MTGFCIPQIHQSPLILGEEACNQSCGHPARECRIETNSDGEIRTTLHGRLIKLLSPFCACHRANIVLEEEGQHLQCFVVLHRALWVKKAVRIATDNASRLRRADVLGEPRFRHNIREARLSKDGCRTNLWRDRE